MPDEKDKPDKPMKVTASDLNARIGQKAKVSINGLQLVCTVVNAKYGYGRMMYEVEPVGGAGRVWVNESKITW